MTARAILATLAALALPVAATAHTFWLQPALHTAAPGAPVTVDFRVGDAGEESAWELHWERVAALRLYGPNGVIDQLAAVQPSTPETPGVARFDAPVAEGSYVIGFESTPSYSSLDVGDFNIYIAHEGLTAVQAHRRATGRIDAPGTELYARRAKALLQVGETRTDNVTRPVGQLLEIVPLTNPLSQPAGDQLPVQVLWRGQPLEGASLWIARPSAQGTPEVLITDAEGKASFTLRHGSRYLLYTVWSVPGPNDKRAEYQTIFASLTFPSPY
ncbi:MAG: DUF4198 domain-containing protein [Erythrobacter sp.]